MAIPAQIEHEEYGAIHASSANRVSSRAVRLLKITAAIAMCMAAIVLLGNSPTSPFEDAVELEIMSPQEKLDRLVNDFANNGAKMSVIEMETKLDQWRHNPETLLDLPQSARTQMLASMDFGVPALGAAPTMSLADESKLCSKKDFIIEKFNQLLKKLGGEELMLNITDDKVRAQYQAALGAWLDSESQYRLTVEKTKEADEGSRYAQQQYEKYHTAYAAARTVSEGIARSNAAEMGDLLDERDLIKEIMRMIGVLHDINATDRDVAAGGRNSVKNQYGVSDPYAAGVRKEEGPAGDAGALRARIDKLQALSLRAKQPQMGQMLHQLRSSLAQFAESEEVAMILKQMLQDIEDRMRVLTNLAAQASANTQEMQAKMIEWQTKLVELSDAADKAKAAAQSEQLQREALAGGKKVAQENAKNEGAAYKLSITPYMKEIYIIRLIMKKITDHCAEVAAAAAA